MQAAYIILLYVSDISRIYCSILYARIICIIDGRMSIPDSLPGYFWSYLCLQVMAAIDASSCLHVVSLKSTVSCALVPLRSYCMVSSTIKPFYNTTKGLASSSSFTRILVWIRWQPPVNPVNLHGDGIDGPFSSMIYRPVKHDDFPNWCVQVGVSNFLSASRTGLTGIVDGQFLTRGLKLFSFYPRI